MLCPAVEGSFYVALLALGKAMFVQDTEQIQVIWGETEWALRYFLYQSLFDMINASLCVGHLVPFVTANIAVLHASL